MRPIWPALGVGLCVAALMLAFPFVILALDLEAPVFWIGATVAAALLSGALCYFFLARRVRRINRVIEAVESIDDVTQRLTSSGGDQGRLETVLNALLGRLEEAERRERQFLASASHELRRPLAALRGELELAVLRRRDASELRHAIELALNDAEAMSRLTDDLLFHARDQAGMLTPDEDLVDLTDLIYGAVDRSQRALRGSHTLHVGDLPLIELRADERGLARLLENLIVNAGKHAGDNAFVAIEASVEAEELLIHITDDGPGVPQDEQHQIFEAFARGDRARAVGGSGLGLSIARSWARAHGGDLTVTSPVHVGADHPGARFTIRLPARRIVDSTSPDEQA